MIGKKLAHYEVKAKIGEGGMGEVYQALDTRLHRTVALKVLPAIFTGDPERMARFEREAQLLAALNHSRIAQIYGVEEVEGGKCLVLEYVDGATLQEVIRNGPLPVETALQYALQISEALEEAHEHGIIHRDLKPANIKITPSGSVKVLDFGLAKGLETEFKASPDSSHSPTISMAATAAGIILGTAGYMSPEQARGQAVDRRTDIWAFGVILFEMLSGCRGFRGETMSDTLAKVLEREPAWETLPDNVPPSITRLLHRCVTKDSRRRLQAIGEARLAIEDCLSATPSTEDVPKRKEAAGGRRWLRVFPWVAAGILAVCLAIALLPRSAEPEALMDLRVEVTPKSSLWVGAAASAVLSPDGRYLAYVVGDADQRNLWIRSLDRPAGIALSGTAGAYNPFFSPDGQWIGYATRTQLKKVSVTGGTPLTLCELNLSRGADWGPDDRIVLAPTPTSGLYWVPAAGGEMQQLTTLAEGEATHRWPQVLPGGQAVLYTSHTQASNFETASLEIVDLESGERKVIHQGGSYGRYVPSGHLVYIKGATLFAAPFDLQKREMVGTPAPVIEGVMSNLAVHGSAQYSFSRTGLLAYLAGTADLPRYSAVWVDRNGLVERMEEEPRTFAEPRISPDGTRLAVNVSEAFNWDAWVYDLERGVSTRLTFDEADDSSPVWSPDGKYLAFSSAQDGALNLYMKPADGSGDIERLTESPNSQHITSWSPDGRFVLYHEQHSETNYDLWILPMEGSRTAELFLGSPFGESEGAFSTDGRWIAYSSDESGQWEIYVRPFPARGGKWQVSVGGGDFPRWSRDGSELFYRSGNGVKAVSVSTRGDSLEVGKPRTLFEGSDFMSLLLNGQIFADYDVAPDGRFIMFRGDAEAVAVTHMQLVTDWFAHLQRTLGGRP